MRERSRSGTHVKLGHLCTGKRLFLLLIGRYPHVLLAAGQRIGDAAARVPQRTSHMRIFALFVRAHHGALAVPADATEHLLADFMQAIQHVPHRWLALDFHARCQTRHHVGILSILLGCDMHHVTHAQLLHENIFANIAEPVALRQCRQVVAALVNSRITPIAEDDHIAEIAVSITAHLANGIVFLFFLFLHTLGMLQQLVLLQLLHHPVTLCFQLQRCLALRLVHHHRR